MASISPLCWRMCAFSASVSFRLWRTTSFSPLAMKMQPLSRSSFNAKSKTAREIIGPPFSTIGESVEDDWLFRNHRPCSGPVFVTHRRPLDGIADGALGRSGPVQLPGPYRPFVGVRDLDGRDA